jgi:hypothetical protein
MALAPYFVKAAQSARNILAGYDHAAFAARLDSVRVIVAYDGNATGSREGRTILEFLVDLLARLYPRLVLRAMDANEAAGDVTHNLTNDLTALARRINPLIAVTADGASAHNMGDTTPAGVVLVVGRTRFGTEAHGASPPILYLGSDGWIARLSRVGPVGSCDSENPFGAATAACFGAANVFRAIFGSQLEDGRLDDEIRLSLLDLDPQAAVPTGGPLPTVDLGETHLVGIGAIGHAASWVLRRIPTLRGLLRLVDGEKYDDTNPQRYVATEADASGPKAEVVAAAPWAATAAGTFAVTGHHATWSQYLACRNNWHLERVALALDTAADRVLVQGALPRHVHNAWTQPENVGVSRHDFANGDCVACLYLPSGERPNRDALAVEALRLDPAQYLMWARQLLDTRQPLDEGTVSFLADHLKVPVYRRDELRWFIGQPLDVFVARAVCGGLVMALGGEVGDTRRVEVPMAFQSALAGVLLAAEVVIGAAGLRGALLPTRTEIDLRRPLGQRLNLPQPQVGRDRCLCRDSAYVAAFRSKYVVPAS